MGGKSKSKQSSNSQNVSSNQGVNNSVGMNYGVNQSGNFGQTNAGSYGQNTSNNFGFNQGNSFQNGGSTSQGTSQGTSQSSSQSTQNVWDKQSPYLEDVYGQAQDAFNSGMDTVNNLSPEVQQQMQDSYQQAAGGFGNQVDGGFAGGLQGQIGPNSYTDAMKAQVADDANTLKQQNLGNLDARAAAAGMSGSSGYKDQVARMQNGIDKNAMNQMSNIGFQAHDKGIQNQMNLAGMMDRNQQFGTQNLQNMQQGAMNQFNPAMVGQQMAAQYGQTIGGPTTLTDSSSQSSSQNTSQNTSNSFNNGGSNNFGMNTGNSQGTNSSFSNGTNMGFSNGMNVGMNQSGGFNNGFGAGASSGQGTSSSWNVQPPSFSFV